MMFAFFDTFLFLSLYQLKQNTLILNPLARSMQVVP